MLLVYWEGSTESAQLLPAFDADDARIVGDQAEFEVHLRLADAGVLLLPELSRQSAVWLGTLQSAAPGRLLLVTHLTPSTLRWLACAGSSVDVVWWEEFGSDVLPRLAQLRCRDALHPLRVLARDVAAGNNPLVARAPRVLSDDVPAPHSVAGLAARVKTTPSTLRYHWNCCLGPTAGPKEMIEWTVLLRALEARPKGGWDRAAYQAGVHRRTLERISRRLLDRPLSELKSDPIAARVGFAVWIKGASWPGADNLVQNVTVLHGGA